MLSVSFIHENKRRSGTTPSCVGYHFWNCARNYPRSLFVHKKD